MRWNYGYGYASSCQANNNRGTYLEKIHNLNIKNKEKLKGYEYYKNKIKNANQEVEKIIVDAEIDFNKKQSAMYEERVNWAKIDD